MTKSATEFNTVSISPDVSILSVLRHLNYKPWYAMAEFVDNSIESFLKNLEAIKSVDGDGATLKVGIEIDPTDGGTITIRDNASGINQTDYERAFRPAEMPPDRSGLAEFGMGMKSAACWFGDRFIVRTSALGEGVERTIDFDIDSIVKNKTDSLAFQVSPTLETHHYTEITISRVHKMPQGRTLGKIREHLASMFRVFIRQGILELSFNGELLVYDEPEVLVAPYFRDTNEDSRTWRKEIDFDLGSGLRASGFVAIRQTGSTSMAGFALFRRNRLIEGSSDETYRPKYIFEGPNSFVYQRLFGELHLEGFDVSHTKDGFRWGENEEPFLELLKEEINSDPLPILDQASGYRVRGSQKKLSSRTVPKPSPISVPQDSEAPEDVDTSPNTPELQISEVTSPTKSATIDASAELNGQNWHVTIELSEDPGVGEWVSITQQPVIETARGGGKARHIGVRVSMAHPIMQQGGSPRSSQSESLARVAAAIALAEVGAREAGVKMAGTVRRNINHLLRDSLSKSLF